MRSFTGLVYVGLTVGAALAGPVTSLLLFLPVAVVAAGELHRLYWRTGDAPSVRGVQALTGALFLTLATAPVLPGWDPALALPAALALILLALGGTLLRGGGDPLHDLGGQLMAALYIALPFGLAPLLVADGRELFLGFMVLLWTGDTAAYVTGRLIGRRPLFARVSPKKTVEGLLGGLAFTLLAAWAIAGAWPVLGLDQWMALAVITTLTGALGDLLESAFKRAAGVKDSGTLLPGHGGVLDRFDGFLLSMPACWAYLQAVP